MVFQAFIDESESIAEGDLFVVSGHIATVEAWENFSREWQELLPWAKEGRSGQRRFKLSEMGISEESMERVAAFYRVLERHVLCSVTFLFRKGDLQRAQARLVVVGREVNWGMLANPYVVAYKGILDAFHLNRDKFAVAIPAYAKVDFIFDDRMEKRRLLAFWDQYVETLPLEARNLVGAAPRFEREEDFLPLQAADLWAGLRRRWVENREAGRDPDNLAGMKVKRDGFELNSEMSEDQLVENLVAAVRKDLPDALIIDIAHFTTSSRHRA